MAEFFEVSNPIIAVKWCLLALGLFVIYINFRIR
jgi:hypothetical protein